MPKAAVVKDLHLSTVGILSENPVVPAAFILSEGIACVIESTNTINTGSCYSGVPEDFARIPREVDIEGAVTCTVDCVEDGVSARLVSRRLRKPTLRR